ncbi:chemotaxis protein CheB [Mucilaginibacter sp. ZT4R22]|uniref:protein-glutamate methylesterase n=1 Tax=Mucilaginibacter pankratovii TaxID=2772110 RepID=A0ABR7WLQ1_9SPHI|nr:chemotaxis protein CheB [Mucilaginibacter pankratovii]MBD1363048.1 chemotaxis protein CheB [Mucilaginibacter pankratovii]
MDKKEKSFKPAKDKIVVIGTSAGGMNASIEFLKQLSPDFPAPVLLVQHISGDASGEALLNSLNNSTPLTCVQAVHGEMIKKGYVYLAPPDHHLLVNKTGHLQVTKGARENRSRPAIDPLFRSAAVAFGNRAIGIILSGYLDDGTAGLIAIQRCGGTCIIQDPNDAEYPDMPKNALNQVDVDFCLPVKEMGSAIIGILSKPFKKQQEIPKDIQKEAEIAERVVGDLDAVNALGEQVPFNCPGCGGVLWKMKEGPSLRFRCFTGHAYTAAALLSEQNNKIEETMWTALRMFEERRNLLTTLAKDQSGATARSSIERAELSQVHIDRIRAILLADDYRGESE